MGGRRGLQAGVVAAVCLGASGGVASGGPGGWPRLIENGDPWAPASVPLRFRVAPGGRLLSASGAISEAELEQLRAVAPVGALVVDTRQESHGLLNGRAVSWWGPANAANAGRWVAEIEADEAARLAVLRARQGHVVTVYRLMKHPDGPPTFVPVPVRVERVESEAEAVARYGFAYWRLPMQDHTAHPVPAVVDALVAQRMGPAPPAWMHFHCQAGKGRASLYMGLLDLLGRCGTVTLEALVAEHVAVGSVDLLRTAGHGPRRDKYAARVTFLRDFDAYCRDGSPARGEAWSAWCGRPGL
jgi:hypothetical protein